jgi:hypothetical protein
VSGENKYTTIQAFLNWCKKVNSKKLFGVCIGILFIFYVVNFEPTAPTYEKIFISAFGAVLTPLLFIAIFGTIALTAYMFWIPLQPFFKWFSRWITRQ